MSPVTKHQYTAEPNHRRALKAMLPLAACLALAMTSTVAHAQLTNQSVACSGAQKTEGEGGSASTFASRQKTEGEGGSASTFASRQKTEGEGGSASTFASRQKTEGEGGSASTWTQQPTAGAIPCKG